MQRSAVQLPSLFIPRSPPQLSSLVLVLPRPFLFSASGGEKASKYSALTFSGFVNPLAHLYLATSVSAGALPLQAIDLWQVGIDHGLPADREPYHATFAPYLPMAMSIVIQASSSLFFFHRGKN
jgi:hypothetical protein